MAGAEAKPAPGGARRRAYMSAQVQLLDACDLRCAHCYNAEAPPDRMPATDEIKRRIDAIYGFAERHHFDADIHLSGGEPTLRRDLLEIVRHIFEMHDGDALLFTNGTRWSVELARDLRAAGLEYVQVSLEGPEDLTDAIRGQGVYRRAMDTLRMLGDEGFKRTVSITITARNFPHLFGFVEQLDALGIHFHMREIFPLGAGAQLMGLAPDQRRRLSEWAVAWSGRSSVGIEDPIHCSVSPAYARGQRGCVAARNHFCVDVDGSVLPCRPLAYRVGSVNDLDAAWHSVTMTRLRERDLGGQCGRCQLKHNCGGCRVHALREGDLFGEDRRCFADEHGLIRTPFEVAAVAAAERVGQQIWRARSTVRGLVDRIRSLRSVS